MKDVTFEIGDVVMFPAGLRLSFSIKDNGTWPDFDRPFVVCDLRFAVLGSLTVYCEPLSDVDGGVVDFSEEAARELGMEPCARAASKWSVVERFDGDGQSK